MSNSRTRRLYPSDRGVVVLIQVFNMILLIFFGFCYLMFGFNAESLIYPLSALLVMSFVWSLWSWKALTKRLFDPYVLFLTAAVLFNGGQAFLEIFHLNKNGILGNTFSPEITLETLFLVTLGLTSFHLGALISVVIWKNIKLRRNHSPKVSFLDQRYLRIVGGGLLLVSSVPTLLVLKELMGIVISFGYSALYGREVATGFGATPRVLATFLVPASLFLLAGSKDRLYGRMISAIVVFSYSSILFFLGQRAWAVMPLIAYAWLWHCFIRPLPKVFLIVAGSGVAFVLFPLIRVTRSITGENRVAFSYLMNSFGSIDNPITVILSEMGGTMMTVAYTLKLVPCLRNFDLGIGYLYAFLTVVPNLFWDVHPTIAHGLASNWLIWTVDPASAALGRGYGFSFIAEAYLNFGWIGTPVVLGLIGFLLARLVLWAQKMRDPAKMATVASFLAFFLMYARGESGLVVRSLFWYAFLPYVLVRFTSRLGRRHGKDELGSCY